MDVQAFNELIMRKTEEVKELYLNKSNRNKKMTKDPAEIDYNSKKTLNLINAALDKKLKSSKAYQKKVEKELLQKDI
jgi:hypothetical protein